MKKKIRNTLLLLNNNSGTTLIEMLVCFILLAIFLVCASSLISSISMLYYSIKGEIYAREVSDIILEKVVSEVDGAIYFKTGDTSGGTNPVISSDNVSIDLYDKTNTHVVLEKKNNKLNVHYPAISNIGGEGAVKSREASDWGFSNNMYNGFELTDIHFYRGGITTEINQASKYGLDGLDLKNYDNNVVLVTIQMHSDRYQDYYYYRFIRLHNVPNNYNWG
ncbi:hypothetical protein SAMN02910369_01234 [Lachnospiraceae bacterium NE2001]|nr:hypothetical protein SAMN02910369_01234 [Lachnospiraceae bacterium NE2001]